MSEGYQKRKTVYSILLGRLVILIVLLSLLFKRIVTIDDFLPALYILLPLNCFYITLCIVFVAKNKYLLKGKNDNSILDSLAYLLLIGLYLAEMGIIICRSTVNFATSDTFTLLIAIIESLLGVHAGLYLAYLFAFPKAELPNKK